MSEGLRFVSPLERVLFFRSVGIAAGLPDEDVIRLVQSATEKRFSAGQTIVGEGEPVRHVYIVVDGQVEIDHGHAFEVVGPGQGVGWLRFTGQYDTYLPIRARTDCTVLEQSAAVSFDNLLHSPRFLEIALRDQARRLIEARGSLPADPNDPPDATPGTPDPKAPTLSDRLASLIEPGRPWSDANLDALVTICRHLRDVRYDQGEVLWRPDDPSESGLFISYGLVDCTNKDGQSVRVGHDYGIGFMDALAGLPRSYTAVAATDVHGWVWNFATSMVIIENQPSMGMKLLQTLARTLHDTYASRLTPKEDELRVPAK